MKKTLIATGATIALSLGALAVLPDGATPCSTIPQNYAEIDKQGIVKRVIVADECFIETGKVGDPVDFVVTDYAVPEKAASKGSAYNTQKSAFIDPIASPKSIDQKVPGSIATTTK